MGKYSIKEIEASEADVVWQESPQATIFTKPNVLQELAHEVHWWGVFKGKEIRCVWPIALNENKQPYIVPFAYWQGPLWTKAGFKQPAHRSLSSVSSVYEKYIDLFLSKYGYIVASLHPSLLDVRVFDWWNYHDKDKPRFTINPRYSATIDNLQDSNFDVKLGLRENRKRDLKKFNSLSDDFLFDSNCTQEEIETLYSKTLGLEHKNNIRNLKSLLKIVIKGYGWIQSIRKREDLSICGLILILFTKNQANLVLNLAQSDIKSNGIMVKNIVNSIVKAKEMGINTFDFNGANSPNRGDDKHSYGASPVLYFDIKLNTKH